jgi:phage shock protein PspC (stress-responsive transcriptional regulator)
MSDATRRRLSVFLFASGMVIGVIGGAGLAEAVFYQHDATILAITSAVTVVLGLLLLVLANAVYRSKIAGGNHPPIAPD